MPPSPVRRAFRRLLRAAPILTALLFARPAAAADRIWKWNGGNALASNSANWVGGVAPAGGDHLIFGSTTPTAPTTWDLAVTVSSVDFTGTYQSTVTLSSDLLVSSSVVSGSVAWLNLAGHRLAVGQDLTATGLSIYSGVVGSTVEFNGGPAGVVSKSGGPLHFENVVFNKNATSTVTVTSNMVVDAGFTMSNGNAILQGVRVDLAQDFFLGGGALDLRTSTIALTGTIPQQLGGSGGGSITSIAGMFIQNASTVSLPGIPLDVFIATKPSSTIYFHATDTFGIGSLQVSGGAAGTRVLLITDNPGSQANLSVTAGSIDFAYLRDLNAAGGTALTATHSVDGGNNSNITISIGGGIAIWKYAGGSALASNAANWVGGVAPAAADFVTFGSTTPSSPCTWDLSVQVASINVIGAYASTITLSTDMLVSGGVGIPAAAASLDLAGHAIRDSGDFALGTSRVFGVSGSSVSLEGASGSTLYSLAAGTVFLPGLSVAKTGSSTVTVSAPLNLAQTFEVKSGTVSAGAFRHEIGGSLRATGGYLKATAATFALSGSGNQTATLAAPGRSTSLAELDAQSPSTTTLGGWNATVFVATTPSSNLVFQTGSSTMTMGTFTVNGQSLGSRIGISGPGALKVTGSASARFAYVSGITASAGANIPALFSLDGGGNSNWTITGVGGAQRIWSYGGGTALASNPANWIGGVAPSTGDFVLFGATTPASPCTWDFALQVASFSISGSYAATVTLSTTLAASDGVRLDAAAGSLDPNGHAIVDSGDWSARAGALVGGVAASSVTFVGAAASNIAAIGAGPLNFGNLLLGKNASVAANVLSNAVISGALETDGGASVGGGNRFDIGGDVRIFGGSFDITKSTLVFSGTTPQQTTGNGQGTVTSIAGLYVQNPTTTTILDVTVGVFVATRPASTVAFGTTGGSPTFGSIQVDGQTNGTRILLVSATPGSANPFKSTGGSSIDYAYVKDLDASGGNAQVATHSIDGGNNTNWTITSVGGLKPIWRYAGGTRLASNSANWTTGVAPSTGDFVLFGASTPLSPCTWDLPVGIASFSVSGVYASTITLSSNINITGAGARFDAPAATIDFNGRSMIVTGDWNAGATTLKSSVSGSSVVFSGPGVSKVTSLLPGPTAFQSFVSSKDAGGVVLAQSDMVVDGDFVILSGTFSAPSMTVNLHKNVVANGGYLDVYRTTAVFSSLTNTQSLTGNGQGNASRFAGLQVQTLFDVTIPDLAADVFIATRPNASVLFMTPTSPLVLAAMTVSGGSGSTRVRMQSVSSGVPAKLTVTSTATVIFASVSDLDSTGGIGIVADDTLDLGGNSSWTFVTHGFGIQSAQFQSAFLSSVTFNWNHNYSVGQSFLAQLSTGSFPNSFAGNLSSTTLNSAATFTGLNVNQAYFAQVSTGVTASFTNAGSTITLAAASTGPVVTAVFAGSATVTWGANGNPPGTRFDLLASTDSLATVTVDSVTFATTATVSGLAANATVYFSVLAENSGGAIALPGIIVTTTTLAVVPAAGAAPSVTSSTVDAFWTSGGNFTGTSYDARISTDGFATVVNSTRVAALTARFSGLLANTTYQLQVRTISRAGVPTAFVALTSATTLLADPGPAAVAFPGVGISSVSAAWTSGGNGAGTQYTAELSTDSFATLVFSSTTQNLSALFGTGGAGPALVANGTYYARVRASSGGNNSGYLVIGSTATLPDNPVSPVANPSPSTSTVNFSWGPGANSVLSNYLAQASTDSFATIVRSSVTQNTSATIPFLTPNTTYQLRVQAVGLRGYNSVFVTASPKATSPTTPLIGSYALFVSSARVTWTDSDPAPVTFTVQLSSDAFTTITASSATANQFADVVGLGPNTTYYARVIAQGVVGTSTNSFTPQATLTFPPAAPAAASSTQTAVTLSWSANGNPSPATLYSAEASSDNFASSFVSSVTAALSATIPGLLSDTTYFLRVRSQNMSGTFSAPVAAASTTTAVAAPGALSFTGVGAADVVANWSAGGNGPGTVYEAQITTGVFPAFNASTRTTALSFDFGGLAVNTTYSFQVRGVGRDGTLTSFIALGTTQTLLLLPGAPAQPILAVGASSVTVSWTSGGNTAGVQYQADLSTDNFASVTLTSATFGLSALFGTGGFGAPLASDATFWFRVRAGGGSNFTSYVGLGSTVTYAADPASPFVASAGTSTLNFAWASGGNAASTVYAAQASSTAFASVLASSQTAGTTVSFGGLLANATYQLRVRALGIRGFTPFVSISSWTQPALPTGLSQFAPGASSVTVTWTAPNAAGTPYAVDVTSTAFPQVYATSVTVGATATFTGLPANTTFFARVTAFAPDGTGPGPAAAPAAATPAVPPPSAAPGALAVSSGVWTWTTGANGPTSYRVELSTMAGFVPLSQNTSVTASSAAGASAVFSGLTPNTTYFVRVRADGWSGSTSFTASTGAATGAAVPVSAALPFVSSGSAVAAWTANGNPTGTVYQADLSTDAFATVNASSITAALQAAFLGLAPNGHYDFRVRALGWSGPTAYAALPSTSTPPSGPGAPAQPFSTVGVASVTVSWTSGGNAPGTVYQAQSSTDSFATVVFTSMTANLSAVFGAGGAGSPLTPDTSYQFRVAASSNAALSAFTALGSTATSPVDPIAPAGVAQSTGSLGVSWSAGGNPSDAAYFVQASTDSFATVSKTAAVASTVTAFGGLTPDATYFLRVRAVSRAGVAGAFVTATATATFAAAPAAPAGQYGTSSATLTWTANGNGPASVYEAQLSTDGFATVNLSSIGAGTSAGFPGLLSNATYFLRVRTLGLDGPTGFATAASSATAAAVPAAPASAVLGVSSATISWSAGGNAAGTTYQAQASSDAFATVAQSSATLNLAATFSALGSNTTYYLRVRAAQWNGGVTAFATAATTVTPAANPVSAPLVAVGTGSIVAAWNANGNAPATVYEAQISTDAFATVNALTRAAATQAGFGGLASNAAYALRVRTIANDGTLGSFVSLPSTTTLLTSPGVPAAPFTAVGVTSVTVAWTSGGNGAGTLYQAQVSSDSFATVVVSSLTANLSVLFGTGGAGSLRADTAYQFQVTATSGASISATVPLGSTTTFALDPSAPAATTQSTGTLTLAWSTSANPADTSYLAQASTNAFATVAASSAVRTGQAVLSGLVPDTAYALRVRAVGRGGFVNAFVTAPSSGTYAATPLAPSAAFGTTTATLTWTAAGNPAATAYSADLSTDSFATVNASSGVAGTSAAFAGLIPNTTYFLRVKAVGLLAPTLYASAAAGATAPNAPLSPVATVLGLSSATLSWSAAGNPAGTLFSAESSTNAFATVAATSVTANAFAVFTGLQSNATAYLRVRTAGFGGFSAYATAAATTTPVAAPLSAPTVSVATGTATVAWGANGNATGTLYDAQISTDAFATVNATKRLAAAQAAFGGLLSNTNYDFRVRAIGNDGTSTAFTALPSTTTALLPPAATASPFPAVGVSSLTVAWATGGNGPGTVYRAQLSTDAFATVSVSSDTQNLTALFGALPANTTYAARVETVNGPNQSPFVVLGSSSTGAFGPTGTAVVAVTSQTVTLDWSPNGNPEPGTSYLLDRDSSAGFPAPTTVTVSSSTALIAGLSMNATYYFRVRAVSAAGAPTGYDATVSTATLPPAPTQPGQPTPTTLGISSISWTWSAAGFAVGYQLYSDSAASVPLNAQSSATFVETALGPNASAYLVAVGLNGSGAGPRSLAGLGWTNAKPPTGTAASAVYATSATLTWGLNGNPAYTGAQVQRSPDGTTYAAVGSTFSAITFTDSGLLGCTTYYYRVRNFNGAGAATAFDSAVNFVTAGSTPLAPSGLTALPRAGLKVALTWSASPSTDVTAYKLYSDGGTGTINFAAPYAVFTSTESSFTTPPLASSAAYSFALRATNRCGVEEQNLTTRAASPAVAAVAALSAVVTSPPGGRHVSGDRVTVAAGLSSGQLTGASSVRFQYRATGTGPWTDVVAALPAHPNPATVAPYYTQWDVTALTPGSYDLRAVAYDLVSSSDPAPSATTILIDPVTPDLSENSIGGGRTRHDETVYASVDNTVTSGGMAAGDPLTRLLLPAGALGTSTATVSVISDPDVSALSTGTAGTASVGLFMRVDLSNSQTVLSGGRTASLTVSYPDANNDGIVDGQGVSAANLKFYSYNAISGTWQLDLTTPVDPPARTVTGATPHFSFFGVFVGAAASSTLDAVRVYPVPFRPNGTNPDEGRPYVAGNLNTGIVFDNLPAVATRVKIFAADGRLVADYSTTGSTTLQWDAKNGQGRDVATGGYFAVISTNGLKSVVRRLSIIR